MPELKLTVVLPGASPGSEAGDLDELMASLAQEAGRVAQLQRSRGFGMTEGPARVFDAIFQGGDALAALMRGAGGWFMRHPHATITFKIESGKGGKTLQLTSYSPVAMAAAAAQLQEYLE